MKNILVLDDERSVTMLVQVLSAKEMTGAERARFADLDVLLLNKPFSSLSLKDSIDKVFT